MNLMIELMMSLTMMHQLSLMKKKQLEHLRKMKLVVHCQMEKIGGFYQNMQLHNQN
jgi:hypothetical protein